MSLDRFWQIYDSELDLIDRVLSSRGTPIDRRPWEAAFFFLEHFILEVSGMTKEEVVMHPMFRDWIQHGRQWYVEKYGKKLVEGTTRDAGAMVALFDTPFELRFPLTVSWPARRKGLTALHFPKRVLRREDSLTFLVSPPNLERFKPRERTALRGRISRVVGLARQIDVDTMFADVGREEDAALASGIRPSLERGVRDVCSGGTDRLSAAVWEFNFAAEKAVKAFLCQRPKRFPKIHDVPKLVSKAVSEGLAVPPPGWIEVFPSEQDAVRHRYGELGAPALGYVLDLYNAALRLSAHCAKALDRSISVIDPGAVMYIKSPWDRTADERAKEA